MPSPALETTAAIIIAVAILCALGIAADLLRHPQKMWIMNLVWPLTGLYSGPLGVWAYTAFGRRSSESEKQGETPLWQAALTGSTHCGAGCALGDFAGEWVVFWTGLVILGSRLMTKYVVAFVFAYLVGIVFQYFAIAPMRDLGPGEGIVAALKADTLSLLAYEIGMFSWMAVTQLLLFPGLEPTSWTFWLMMQIAMLLGLATTFPVNWMLIRHGIKERM